MLSLSKISLPQSDSKAPVLHLEGLPFQITHPSLCDQWEGPHVTSANPNFQFEGWLKASVHREQQPYVEHQDVFGDSSLSSADSSSLPSPLLPPVDLFGHSPLSSLASSPENSPKLQPAAPNLVIPDIVFAETIPHTATPSEDEPDAVAPSSSTSKASQARDRRSRRKSSSRVCRQKKRDQAREATYGHYRVRAKVQERYTKNAMPIKCELDTKDANVTSTGWTGKDDHTRSRKKWNLDQVTGPNSELKFRKVEWDGRTSIPIVDAKRRLVALLAGHPDDAHWPSLHREAAQALEDRRWRCNIPKQKRRHRRGAFIALSTGVSHGGGPPAPHNLSNEGENRRVIQELNGLEPFKRIAGFASACMASWAPMLYSYYATKLGSLHNNIPALQRIWNCCIFSAATYNFGPWTVCFRHVDFANLAFGWCSVTALGRFDPKKGGHLILWDLHLVIEFPPGSTILLPSAIIAHSNVSIAQDERRYSFALYSAGALFRWVDNKFLKAPDYLASLSEEELAQVEGQNAARWKLGLSLIPTLSERDVVAQA